MAYHGHGGTLETSNEVRACIAGREIEYNLPRSQFEAIANTRPKNNNDPRKYVLDYLNETGNFMGKIVKINIDEEPIHIVHIVDEE